MEASVKYKIYRVIPVWIAKQISVWPGKPLAAVGRETFSSGITTTAKYDSFLLRVPSCYCCGSFPPGTFSSQPGTPDWQAIVNKGEVMKKSLGVLLVWYGF